jgi:hypothetical protein
MNLDDKLEGWDAGLLALISKLEAYKSSQANLTPKETIDGWGDAIHAARKLIGDARTQKGLLARARGVEHRYDL